MAVEWTTQGYFPTPLANTDYLLGGRGASPYRLSLSSLLWANSSGNVGVGVNANDARLRVAGVLEISDDTASILRMLAVNVITRNSVTGLTTIATNNEAIVLAPAGSATVRPGTDNATPLGSSAIRWAVVYAGTGSINTSDAREKRWIGPLSEGHQRAARRIATELGLYQWIFEIAAKGDDTARLHFGARAQDVIDVFVEEGLEEAASNSFRHAFLCFDEWDELTEPVMETVEIERVEAVQRSTGQQVEVNGQMLELFETVEETVTETEMRDTGETRVIRAAGSRYGLRPDQLALFLIAAQEARIAALEALFTDEGN